MYFRILLLLSRKRNNDHHEIKSRTRNHEGSWSYCCLDSPGVSQKYLEPGITTKELDAIAEKFIRQNGATPSFKGYGGFPGSICISVNEELVHGIPGKRKLREGDIVSIDIGACVRGYHGDSAWTYAIGKITEEDKRLMEVTEQSLYAGLAKAKPNARLSDISHAIQQHVEQAGFSIVREYVGHGIGTNLHEDPQIPNYGLPGKRTALEGRHDFMH